MNGVFFVFKIIFIVIASALSSRDDFYSSPSSQAFYFCPLDEELYYCRLGQVFHVETFLSQQLSGIFHKRKMSRQARHDQNVA